MPIKAAQGAIVIVLHLLRVLRAQVDLLGNLEGGKKITHITDFERVKIGEKPLEAFHLVGELNCDLLKVIRLVRLDSPLGELATKVMD